MARCKTGLVPQFNEEETKHVSQVRDRDVMNKIYVTDPSGILKSKLVFRDRGSDWMLNWYAQAQFGGLMPLIGILIFLGVKASYGLLGAGASIGVIPIFYWPPGWAPLRG
mmetsp:Transcript_55326/g.98667  ORF Transcript_55326/g.98667 Transcript_55326/m.98667 type:complete len:110 (-) Transcript_55326:255-584(-)